VVIGLLVVSHWVLDWTTHVPDLPLYPGGPRVGLGIWRSMCGTMVVEGMMFALGVTVYTRVTRATDRTGRLASWGFVVLLAVLYVANAYGPPPGNVTAIAWGTLASWLIPLFGWWLDRHRATV
jgi:hypothetical protein